MPTPPTTAVPFPQLGPNGFLQPTEAQILAGVQSDINAAFGGNLNPALSTPQGQIAMSETAIIGDSFAMFAWFCNMVDPAYTVGRMQDAIGRIYFIERIPGSPTVQSCLCLGLSGATIPVGALAQDPTGGLWIATSSGVITNGSVTLNFSSTTDGPLPGPLSLIIYQAVPGWESIAPTGDPVLGTLVESPAQFEIRRSQSTGLNSMGPLNAVYGALLNVPNVLDVYITQNNTASPVTVLGVTIAAHSMYACVLGGNALDIGNAIYTRKMPGCGMTGNITVTVTDPNPLYSPPVPTTPIIFEIPSVIPMVVVVTLNSTIQVPANAPLLIQNAIISAFAGGDGGPRARIGSVVLASRYYPTVTAISNTYNGQTGQVIPGWSSGIVSIQVGVDGTTASIIGSISGTTLTVSAMSSGGPIGAGNLLEGSGILPNGSGTPLLIVSQLSGSVGGTGTYSLNLSSVVAGGTMTVTTLFDDVQMAINQAPAISAANIYLNLVSV